MTFTSLALIVLVGLVGPLVSWRSAGRVPLVVGELLVGALLGASGIGALRADEPTFAFLGQVGFALVMFVAGSKVPMGDAALRSGVRRGGLRVGLVAAAALIVGPVVASVFDTGHGLLYAVILASSSAALILPVLSEAGKGARGSRHYASLVAQVAVADILCIIALPLVIGTDTARAVLGVAVVVAAATLMFLALRWAERSGWRRRVHRISEEHEFVIELRVALGLLFTLAALASSMEVTVMLAGFALGLVVAKVGEPRRVAKQMFAITEGFGGPLFFIWLGASLNLHDLLDHSSAIVLGLSLGGAALACHALGGVVGQPWSLAALTCAQLGVPVAAVTIAGRAGMLRPGEAAAILLGALITVAVTPIVSGRARAALAAVPAGPTNE